MKTSELTGDLLDKWVAKADQTKLSTFPERAAELMLPSGERFWPSRKWSQGGPIIERENISLVGCVDWTTRPRVIEQYGAVMFTQEPEVRAWGATHLIAAMRCYVASKFGEEVDDSQTHIVQS